MKRLIFYSDQILGKSDALDDRLLAMLEGSLHRIGFIPSTSDSRRRYFRRAQDHYGALGITEILYFDVDREYDATLLPDLWACDAIHLGAGDVTEFSANIQKRNMAHGLKNFVSRGGLLIGVSAGAMLMGKTIALAKYFEESVHKLKSETALNLVDFDFFPHYEGDAKAQKVLAEHSKKSKVPVYACDDSDGIVVDGGQAELIGSPIIFEMGMARGFV